MVVWLNVHAHTAAEQLEEKTVLVDSITNSIYDCASSLGCFWDDKNLDLAVYRRQLWSTIAGPADVFVCMHFCRRVEFLNLHPGRQHQCKPSFVWVWWCVILLGKSLHHYSRFDSSDLIGTPRGCLWTYAWELTVLQPTIHKKEIRF